MMRSLSRPRYALAAVFPAASRWKKRNSFASVRARRPRMMSQYTYAGPVALSMPSPPGRAGPGQDQTSHEVGAVHGDLLRDEPTQRKTQDIYFCTAHRVDEPDGRSGHVFNRGSNPAGPAT